MRTSSPHSRPSDDAFRPLPARDPVATLDGLRADGPSEREVLGEIGITLAVHLAVALAIVVALQAFGIA